MKDHNSGAKEQAEEGGVGGAGANVVPFPRSWYGSVDELVPIDPVSAAGPDRAGASTEASAFWGGDDTGPTADQEHSSDRVTNDPEVEPVVPDPPRVKPGAQPSTGRRGLPGKAGALALIALAGVAVIGVLSGSGTPGGAGTGLHPRKPVLTVTQTVPQTTTVMQTVTAHKRELVRHRSTRRDKRPVAAELVSTKQTTTTATNAVQSPAPPRPASSAPDSSASSPSRSSPSSSSSGSGTPPASRGSSSSTAGSSKPSCAPSVTNGGACSL